MNAGVSFRRINGRERVGERQSLRPGKAHTCPLGPTLISSNVLTHCQMMFTLTHSQMMFTLALTHKGLCSCSRSSDCFLFSACPQTCVAVSSCPCMLLALLDLAKPLVAPLAPVPGVPPVPHLHQLHCVCLLRATCPTGCPAAASLARVKLLCHLPFPV